MIDWLTFGFAFDCPEFIRGDLVYCIDQVTGEVRWSSEKAFRVVGSWDTGVQVRRDTEQARLWIDGNPAKFLQGHNLFGSSDLPALSLAFAESVFQRLSLKFSPDVAQAVLAGQLSRADITESYRLANTAQARAWLAGAVEQASLRHRGRGVISEGTLYFGKHSRRWAHKFYVKADELKDHPLAAAFDDSERELLLSWVEGVLRSELVMRSLELKKLGLDKVGNWSETTARELYQERLSRLILPGAYKVSGVDLIGLRPAVRVAYDAWEAGVNLRHRLPRASFYRYRAELLKLGIDIANPAPNPATASNVVPLVRVLEAVPAGVPEWAEGSRLLFSPLKAANS